MLWRSSSDWTEDTCRCREAWGGVWGEKIENKNVPFAVKKTLPSSKIILNDCAPLGRLGTGSGPEDRLTRTSRAMVPSWLWRQSSPEPSAAAGCSEPPRGTPYDPHSGPVRKHRTLEQTAQTRSSSSHDNTFNVTEEKTDDNGRPCFHLLRDGSAIRESERVRWWGSWEGC